MPEPFLLWFNTLILLISSILFITTLNLLQIKMNLKLLKKRLLIIGFLALLFLIGQFLVWLQLIGLGYYVSSNPANAYFYVFTGLHGLHLMGGLIYWMVTIKKVWITSDIVIANVKHTVELCGIYWHFLFAVWVILFGLMLFT